MPLVIASNNAHKIKEIRCILGNFFGEVYSMKDVGLNMEIEETGATFEENSLIKAEAVCKETGMPSLADDSGLCVDCLNGAPGVYSARYAGIEQNDEKNIEKLLEVMQGKTNRKAQFVTALTLLYPDGKKIVAIGQTKGEITKEKCGNGGFGYDPVFYSYELNKTFGEADEKEKNSVSHRAKALIILEKAIKEN